MDSVQAVPDSDDEVLLVPLVGHTGPLRGGRTHRFRLAAALWDAYFYRGELDEQPSCLIGLRFFQWLMAMDNGKRLANQRRLRRLKDRFGDEITMTSSRPRGAGPAASAASYRAQHAWDESDLLERSLA